MSWASTSIDGRCGLAPFPAPAWTQTGAPEPPARDARPVGGQTRSFKQVVAASDGSAGFQVQILAAPDAERGAPPSCRETMLAAYRAHLAGRIRYFGPLAPVDLRI